MKKFKKIMALVICFAMVLSMVPSIATRAEEMTEAAGSKLRFAESILADVDVTYKIGNAEAVQVDGGQKDENGYVWVDVADGNNVVITATQRGNQAVKEIRVFEGENSTAAAFDGQYDSEHTAYSFPVRSQVAVYVVEIELNNGGQQGGNDPTPGEHGKIMCVRYYGESDLNDGRPVDETENNTSRFLLDDQFREKYIENRGGAFWKVEGETRYLVLDGLKTDYLVIEGEGEFEDGLRPGIKVKGTCEIGTFRFGGTSLEISPYKEERSGDNAGENNEEENLPILKVGKFEGNYGSDMSRLSFRDEVRLEVGTGEEASDVAFENVETVSFWNFDFHNREYISDKIYARVPFLNVNNVEIISAKVEITCSKLLDNEDAEADRENRYMDTGKVYTYQEGKLTVTADETENNNSLLNGCTIKNKYYSHYPTSDGHKGLATEEDYEEGRPANGLVNTYVAETEDLSTVQESVRKDKEDKDEQTGYYSGMFDLQISGVEDEKKSFVLESLDPILYSVSYHVDSNKEKEIYDHITDISSDTGVKAEDISATAGTFTMEGFERGYYINDPRDGHFEAWIAAEEEVKVKIIPNEGYQYLAGTVNVNSQYFDTTAGEDVGVYTYKMGAHAGHLSAGFIKTENLVVNEASEAGVTGGTIADAGINAEMTLGEDTPTDAEKEEFGKQADGATFDSFVDIGVAERIVKNFDVTKKNHEQEAWTTKQEELKQPATVTIQLDSTKYTANDYQVVRRHKNKDNTVSYDKIPAEYDAAKHTLTFVSDKFSTYAIGAKEDTPVQPPAHVHSGAKVEGKAATCTEDGYKAYYTCSCKKNFEDEKCTKEITNMDSLKIAKLGHDFGTNNEKCSRCGEKNPDYKQEQTKPEDPKTEEKTDSQPENNKSAVKAEDNNKVTTTDKGEATITELKETKSKSVTVPSSTKVGDYTYTVTTIGKEAFKNAKKATTVTLPNTITKINANAFAKSKITTVKVTVKKGAKLTVDKKAFKKSKVKKVQVTISKKATKKEKDAITKVFTKAGIKKGNIKFKKK